MLFAAGNVDTTESGRGPADGWLEHPHSRRAIRGPVQVPEQLATGHWLHKEGGRRGLRLPGQHASAQNATHQLHRSRSDLQIQSSIIRLTLFTIRFQ